MFDRFCATLNIKPSDLRDVTNLLSRLQVHNKIPQAFFKDSFGLRKGSVQTQTQLSAISSASHDT